MGKLSNTIPVGELTHDAENILDSLKRYDDPLFITQRGRAAAVIIGIDAYEKSEKEKAMLRLLVEGNREIETGQGVDLDTVLNEADHLLGKKLP